MATTANQKNGAKNERQADREEKNRAHNTHYKCENMQEHTRKKGPTTIFR